MTAAERAIWFAIRDRRLDGHQFKRQMTVGRYIVDFACMERRLVVEIDGGQHTPEIDTARTPAIEAAGFTILRFWNNEVIGDLDGVLATLLDRLPARSLTQPSPASGRGL